MSHMTRPSKDNIRNSGRSGLRSPFPKGSITTRSNITSQVIRLENCEIKVMTILYCYHRNQLLRMWWIYRTLVCDYPVQQHYNMYAISLQHLVLVDMKRCICHFTKWQIHPFISDGTIYVSGPSLKVPTRTVTLLAVACQTILSANHQC